NARTTVAGTRSATRHHRGVHHGKHTGGDGELARRLRASGAITDLDRGLGGWCPHGWLGGYLRVVVLRRPPCRRGEAGRLVHGQRRHRRPEGAVVARGPAGPGSPRWPPL